MQKICIIIPCYNEGDRLPVKEFNNFLTAYDSVFFYFVNDGSNDNTSEILNSLRSNWSEKTMVLNLSCNCGKAEAVRRGVLESLKWQDFDYVGYFDADLSTPLSEIQFLLDNINQRKAYQIAFGSRVRRIGARVERNAARHYPSRILATLIGISLKLPVYDTQCGAKLMKVGIIPEIFKMPFISRWFFDVEIFARVIRIFGLENSLNIMIEVPLRQWIDAPGSKIRPTYLFKAPLELLKIHLAYHRRNE
jgi:dolichyl-phosphate beta-glucosyltransferase